MPSNDVDQIEEFVLKPFDEMRLEGRAVVNCHTSDVSHETHLMRIAGQDPTRLPRRRHALLRRQSDGDDRGLRGHGQAVNVRVVCLIARLVAHR